MDPRQRGELTWTRDGIVLAFERPRRVGRALAAVSTGTVAAGAWALVAFVISLEPWFEDGGTHAPVAPAVGLAVVFTGAFALAAWASMRGGFSARLALVVERGEVAVQGTWTRRRVSLADVREIEQFDDHLRLRTEAGPVRIPLPPPSDVTAAFLGALREQHGSALAHDAAVPPAPVSLARLAARGRQLHRES